jgi:hypothetical protein
MYGGFEVVWRHKVLESFDMCRLSACKPFFCQMFSACANKHTFV